MGGTFTSWGALKGALQEELAAATREAVDGIFDDARINVGHFYDAPEGRYHRTGQLKNTPMCTAGSSGDSASGAVWLNTGFSYNPSGRSTQEIFSYAENGGLLGNGGFWEKTVSNADSIIDSAFSKHFG